MRTATSAVSYSLKCTSRTGGTSLFQREEITQLAFIFAVLRLTEGFSGHCNFEFDMCSWRQSKEDDFDWLIKAGSTPTLGTGPSNDHTLRDPSGHYLYLEGSFPQAAGETARLTGPVLSRRSSQCKVSRPVVLTENCCTSLCGSGGKCIETVL